MCKAYEREVRKRINEGIEIGERKGIKIGESRGIKIGESRGIKIGESRGIKIGEKNGKQKALNELKKLVDSLKNNNIEFDAFRIISDDDYRNNMLELVNH